MTQFLLWNMTFQQSHPTIHVLVLTTVEVAVFWGIAQLFRKRKKILRAVCGLFCRKPQGP